VEASLVEEAVDVSILTPSLGYGRFIEENILSVARQEGVSVQHIIQDGGSRDETIEVLHRYDHTVEWASEPDTGQSAALNHALRKARGRWIGWLNADDFYLVGGLAELVRKGDATRADVVYGDSIFVDEDGKVARLLPQHPFSVSILRMYGCFIPSASTIFRRSSLPPEPWDPSVRMMMDWDLYLRLSSGGAVFEKVSYPVAAFRRHEEQITAQPASEFRAEYLRLFARHGISPSSRRWGRWLHGAYKLWVGAYLKQLRGARFRGLALDWHRSEAARTTFDALLGACYRHAVRRSEP
jgi:glycosyltransferase involved in cell wall biosynthesis